MLRSRDLSYFIRLQNAARNAPPMRLMEQGDPVQALQRALSDLGYSLPRSFAKGAADGIYGQETINAIREFQAKEALQCDGIAGNVTLHLLDYYLGGPYAHKSSMNGLLTTASAVRCPHGVPVLMPIPRFGPVPTTGDTFAIAGCSFSSPCRQVKWTVSNSRIRFSGQNTLDRSSVGLCLDMRGGVNGQAAILY